MKSFKSFFLKTTIYQFLLRFPLDLLMNYEPWSSKLSIILPKLRLVRDIGVYAMTTGSDHSSFSPVCGGTLRCTAVCFQIDSLLLLLQLHSIRRFRPHCTVAVLLLLTHQGRLAGIRWGFHRFDVVCFDLRSTRYFYRYSNFGEVLTAPNFSSLHTNENYG